MEVNIQSELDIEIKKQQIVNQLTNQTTPDGSKMSTAEAATKADAIVQKLIDKHSEAEEANKGKNRLKEKEYSEALDQSITENAKEIEDAVNKKMAEWKAAGNFATEDNSHLTKDQRFNKSFNRTAMYEIVKIAQEGRTKLIDTPQTKVLAPQSVGTAADGGTLVPEAIDDHIKHLTDTYGKARTEGSVLSVPTQTFKQYTRNAVLAAAHTDEAAAIADDKWTLTTVTHTSQKFAITNVNSDELLQWSNVDIENEVMDQAARAFALAEDSFYFQSKTAVGSTGFTGMFTAPTEVDLAATETSILDADYADYLAAIGTATDAQAMNAKWFMNRSTMWQGVNLLVDTNNHPIMQGGAIQPILMGHDIVTSDQINGVPEDAVSLEFAAFGNGKNIYLIDTIGLKIKLLTEGTVDTISLAETDQIGFRWTKSFSIENLFATGFFALKTAAS